MNGQEAKIIHSKCNENGIHVLTFSQPRGPVFHYEEPNNETFGDQPHLKDPLDKKYGYFKKSTIPNADEGFFAARDIPKDINLVLYGGFLYNKNQSDEREYHIIKRITENDDPNWHIQRQNDMDLFRPLSNTPFFE